MHLLKKEPDLRTRNRHESACKEAPAIGGGLFVPSGGDGGTRTPDLYSAIVALSQLSYVPLQRTEYTGTVGPWSMRFFLAALEPDPNVSSNQIRFRMQREKRVQVVFYVRRDP